MPVNVTVRMPGLDKIRQLVLQNPALKRRIVAAWDTIFRSFIRRRYVKLSRGGGEWPSLAPATVRARRKGKGKGGPAILRDTNALFASTQPQLTGSGSLLQSKPIKKLGFTVTFGGSKSYESGPTLAEVAEYHQKGEGRLPKRKILVEPDRPTVDNMAKHGHRIAVGEINKR